MRALHLLPLLSLACAAPAPRTAPPVPSSACTDPRARELDFWLGDWELLVRARTSSIAETWQQARATNCVRARYGGCVVEERFRAEGPGQPWAGASASVYQPSLQSWRQTWVDDSGSYLAFRGGPEGQAFVLYGEPQERQGKRFQMRMVFDQLRRDSLSWRWERQAAGAASWVPQMEIEYRRAPEGSASCLAE